MKLGHINEKGQYVRGEDKNLGYDRNTMEKQYSHDMGRKEFAREIIQPHIGDKPNPEFVKNYPEYSHRYWTQEEIDKALRRAI